MRQFQKSIIPLEGIPAGLQSNWERPLQAWEHLGVPVANLGAPATSLGAPQITVAQSGKSNNFFRNAAGVRLEIIATTNRLTIFKTHVFSLYPHL
jgi:hypothetical protein